MAESKLKFYTGDVTNGQKDGHVCKSLSCVFPLVLYPSSTNYSRVPIKFALRCDEGYKAEDVKLTCSGSLRIYSSMNYDFTNSINFSSYISVGNVTNANIVLYIFTGHWDNYQMKLYASYTEVKL